MRLPNGMQVPESQHSIFVRGFPGDLDMSRIKQFFEKEAGHCTFDFFKQSADKTALFVAVRFDTREVAREAMTRFNNQEVFGYPVQMSWFKDIRRFATYTGQDRGGGGWRGGGRGGYDGQRGGYYNPRMQHWNGGGGRGGMRPPYQNYNNQNYYHNRDHDSGSSRTVKYRESRSSSRHSRSRSPYRSDDDRSAVARSRSPPPRSPPARSRSRSKSPIRAPEPDHEDSPARDSPKRASPPVTYSKPKRKKKEKRRPKRASSLDSRSSGELSTASPREKKRRGPRSPPYEPGSPLFASEYNSASAQKPLPKITVSLGQPSEPAAELRCDSPISGGLFGDLAKGRGADARVESDFMNISNTAMNKIVGDRSADKLQPAKRPAVEGKFKLSTVTKQVSAESERQRRIRNLPPDKADLLQNKRTALNEAYKADCETFATVVKMLVSKDPAIEERLLNSLREALKDIGEKFVVELNEFIDTLIDE